MKVTHIINGEEKETKDFKTRQEAYKFLLETRKTDNNQDYWVMG